MDSSGCSCRIVVAHAGMLYIDILEAKHDTKVQLEKVEKLRRDIERQQRKDKDK